jgi:hypothetical protein
MEVKGYRDTFWNQGGIDRGAGEMEAGRRMETGEWRGLGRDKREQETLVTGKAGKEETTQCYRKYVLCNQTHIKNALLIKRVKCSKEISNRNVYGYG